MHALQRDVLHGHVGVLAHFTLFKADERLIGKQVVLALAGRAAGIAANALLGIDEHSVACHHSPTFCTETNVSWVMAEP